MAMAAPHASQTPLVRGRGRPSRYRQIIEILARHGLGFIVGTLSLEGLHALRSAASPGSNSSKGSKGSNGQGNSVTAPERLRLAIEELGPTFIKLGQILSSRNDLLPAAYRDELAKLQDAAPPIPAEQVRAILREELGRPVDEVFAKFDMTALASASIGQAHAATLFDGTEVVVKLRRPEVVERVDEDLHILIDLALRASRHWEFARYYDLVAIAHEFAQTLRAELDYVREGRNVERITENFADDSAVHIPRVYWETTSSRMLTLERIRGIKFTDVVALDAAGFDRSLIAHRAARILLTMMLKHGFFHADPHAGNVFVEQGETIGLIDFGMVGEVDRGARDLLVRLVVAMTRYDASQLADAAIELGMGSAHVDRNALRRDLQRFLARYMGRPLGDVKFGAMLGELIDIMRVHHLRLPPDLALLVKTLGMAEGLAAQVYPPFDLMDVYVPLAQELMQQQFSPGQWARQLLLSGIDALQSGLELPQHLRRVLGDIERGGFEITVQPASFDPYLERLEQLVNRAILALLASTFTIAAALLLAAYHPAHWDWVVEVLFLAVLLAAGGFGTYILVLLLRSKHKRP
jgi:ubiquinone biosynthesis protein